MQRKIMTAIVILAVCLQALLAGELKLKESSWDKAETLYPGILHLYAEATEPRIMKVHAIRLDMSSGRLEFFTTPKADIWGKPMPDFPSMNAVTKRQSTRNFLLQARERKSRGGYGLNMVLAVNASPWSPWEAPFTHTYGAAMGLNIAQGEILDPNDKDRPSFVVLKKGGVDFRTKKNPIDPKDIYISCPGFIVVLEKGVIEPNNAKRKDLAPRTGYGLSKDRKYVYFIVVDGRQPTYSMGCTVGEVGKFLQALGAYDALNMDGGGSTTLVTWDKHRPRGKEHKDDDADTQARILNHQPGGAQRNNGNNLGVILKRNS